jgi:23S rRNA pseudouridine1911/1915/1917 synthase
MANLDDFKLLTIVEGDLAFRRLDILLSKHFPELSRTQIQNFFDLGLIQLNGSTDFNLSKVPPVGSKIIITMPPPINYELEPENIPLEILFEDEDLVFINKPAGLCVHPAAGNWHHTLVHALLFHCPDLKGIGNVKRPGIVHRLDIGTSGVMVVAKSHDAHRILIEKFKKHDLIRKYEAMVLKKNAPTKGVIESMIDRSKKDRKKMTALAEQGKKAITHYQLLHIGKKFNHIECKLETGRTHQIRVHMSEKLGTPIVNDYLYANPKQHLLHFPERALKILNDYPYPLLHAKTLGLAHPLTNQWLEFNVSAPSPFKDLLELLYQDEL